MSAVTIPLVDRFVGTPPFAVMAFASPEEIPAPGDILMVDRNHHYYWTVVSRVYSRDGVVPEAFAPEPEYRPGDTSKVVCLLVKAYP